MMPSYIRCMTAPVSRRFEFT